MATDKKTATQLFIDEFVKSNESVAVIVCKDKLAAEKTAAKYTPRYPRLRFAAGDTLNTDNKIDLMGCNGTQGVIPNPSFINVVFIHKII